MNAVTAAPEKESKIGYVGRRLSNKQKKLYLAFTPKHGAIKRELMKFYMGMRKTAPEQSRPRIKDKK